MSTLSVASASTKLAPRLQARRKWGGLLTRGERWHLSARAWLLLLLLIAISTITYMLGVYPFLAMERRLDTDVLVVEGWVHHYAMREAAAEFRNGGYRLVFTTGGPVAGSGGYINDFNTYASVGAELLIAAGIPREQVQMVPSRETRRDRTYTSAVILRRWLEQQPTRPARVNVMTESVHARRTWLLFRRALQPEVEVGIIPIANPDFEPKRWWHYSEGVRDVLGETIAWLYARFVFYYSAEVSG